MCVCVRVRVRVRVRVCVCVRARMCVSIADLDRGFVHGEKEHRPPPTADEISFEEAMTPAIAKKYWDILKDAAKKLGGYARDSSARLLRDTPHYPGGERGPGEKGFAKLVFPSKYEEWGT